MNTKPQHQFFARFATIGAVLGTALWFTPVTAQTQPAPATVKLVVPYTAGGFTDQVARLLAEGMHKETGVPHIVDNKPGANGVIGADFVAKARADGSTLGVVIPAFVTSTLLSGNLPYRLEDLQPVSLIGMTPLVAFVNKDSPFNDVKSLITYAQQNPGKLSYGSSGIGSGAHLATELLKSLTQTYMVHIPYRGETPALTDLIGGQIQLLLGGGAALIGQAKAGKIKMIGVASEKRLPVISNVPTFVEQGVSGFVSSSWAGVIAAKGVPSKIVQSNALAIRAVLQNPEARQRLERMGTIPVGSSPADFQRFLDQEKATWAHVIQNAKIEAP
jgi:tripartite-type tricarboxylate transporter receptor subunit TctC